MSKHLDFDRSLLDPPARFSLNLLRWRGEEGPGPDQEQLLLRASWLPVSQGEIFMALFLLCQG